jgi:hypothetical protein
MTDQFEALMTALSEYKKLSRIHFEHTLRHSPVFRELVTFLTRPASRDGQKKSRPARRANLVPRDNWIRKFYADKKRADPKYSKPQLGKDLRATHNMYFNQLRPGGKFLSDEQLRLIVKN